MELLFARIGDPQQTLAVQFDDDWISRLRGLVDRYNEDAERDGEEELRSKEYRARHPDGINSPRLRLLTISDGVDLSDIESVPCNPGLKVAPDTLDLITASEAAGPGMIIVKQHGVAFRVQDVKTGILTPNSLENIQARINNLQQPSEA